MLGEHAHVVQPITKVNGKWVVYGMGNMVAQQEAARPDTYQGILVRFTFVERRGGGFEVRRAAYVPIGWNHWHPGTPIRVRPTTRVPAAAGRRRRAVYGLGRTPRTAGRVRRTPYSTMQAVPTRRNPTPS